MTRECKLIVGSGSKGAGKSYTTFRDYMLPYIKGWLTGRPKRILILDVNDEWGCVSPNPADEKAKRIGWTEPYYIKKIHYKDIPKFNRHPTIEMRRVVFVYTETQVDKKGRIIARKGDLMNKEDRQIALIECLRTFRGGLLLVEDMLNFFVHGIPDLVVSEITRNRHKDQDLIWHLQSIAQIARPFWSNINYVRFHKQSDNPEIYANRLTEPILFSVAHLLVNKMHENGSTRFHLLINIDKHKLEGDFKKIDLYFACYEYVRTHTAMMRNYLNIVDSAGKKQYTFKSAMEKVVRELYDKYNGNLE